jgi:hypothetical protein
MHLENVLKMSQGPGRVAHNYNSATLVAKMGRTAGCGQPGKKSMRPHLNQLVRHGGRCL